MSCLPGLTVGSNHQDRMRSLCPGLRMGRRARLVCAEWINLDGGLSGKATSVIDHLRSPFVAKGGGAISGVFLGVPTGWPLD